MYVYMHSCICRAYVNECTGCTVQSKVLVYEMWVTNKIWLMLNMMNLTCLMWRNGNEYPHGTIKNLIFYICNAVVLHPEIQVFRVGQLSCNFTPLMRRRLAHVICDKRSDTRDGWPAQRDRVYKTPAAICSWHDAVKHNFPVPVFTVRQYKVLLDWMTFSNPCEFRLCDWLIRL